MTPSRSFAGALATAALATLAFPHVASARDFKAQNNEFTFDVTATFAKQFENNSDMTLQYTWFPGALDQNDEVVPALRPFVRQPAEVTVRIHRFGDAYDTITGLYGDATGWLGERIYGNVELGLEYDSVENERERRENAFMAASGRVEAGVRVLPLLQLGGFYRFRPVVLTFPEVALSGLTSERSGATHELGLSIGLATPDDRLLLDGKVGYRMDDWTFEGEFPGEITGDARFASLHASVQFSPTTSIFARGELTSTDWHNGRAMQPEITMRGTDGTVLGVQGDVGFLYWFEGHWAFRLTMGGGYIEQGPLFQSIESGLFRIGLGFTTRY